MEEREIFGSEHLVKGDEARESFHVASRTEDFMQFPGTAAELPAVAAEIPAVAAEIPTVAPVSSVVTPVTEGKKKRGRPRKYGPDGKVAAVARALSPMPISASIQLTGQLPAWKRGIGKPMKSVKKFYEVEYAGQGDGIAYSVGANFSTYVLTVNAGEDVTMKIMSFSQQGHRATCILSANGTISNVTLRQPTSSGGTLTYEGQFEIVSLSGSFMPTENGLTKSRSGGMSVSLVGPDGRLMGGGLAGLLVAAGPVQVVVASFLPSQELEQKSKRPRMEHISNTATTHVSPISAEEIKNSFGGVKPIMVTTDFQVDNYGSYNNGQGSRNLSADDEAPLQDKDSNPTQLGAAGVAC
ncbi:hypothetical protein TanjilG_17691 [Lupinus angustifolius]|uniref:AT-hook motif nuclear-localized protein n=1 Tax=Lupinus angustifolius TaxID=3871 RepID=A0A1J7HX07_LUPAN|nr:PREDICTED: AT-hook motif nuclear-localized protein 6-like [Lupinus angustifolius]OIW06317.1 hypothetical protein TanjilG_17691 [Lupinus angustifolius]